MVAKFHRKAGALAAAALLMLGGCSTISSLTGGSSESSGGSSSSSARFWRNTFMFGSSEPPPIVRPDDNQRTVSCPAVAVIDGTSAFRIARAEGGSGGVNYQASVAQFARECQLNGNTLAMRVGVEGRLLLGPEGKPGTFQIPVRVAVKDGEKVVYSRVTRVGVTIPPDASQASFTYIDDNIALPIGVRDPGDEYDVLVGFDPGGPGDNGEQKPKRPRRRH